MNEKLLVENLEKYIPAKAIPFVVKHLCAQDTLLKITPKRKRVEATYSSPRLPLNRHTITINNDLNEYAFLFTLMHEIAHMKVRIAHQHKPTPKPHGYEWKSIFSTILLEIMDCFPSDIIIAIENHIQDVAAATCRDKNLYKTFRQYDKETAIYLDDIPILSFFKIKGDIHTFQKISKIRKNFMCIEISSKLRYRVSGLAIVEKIDA